MNNPVSLIANDAKPLGATANTIHALNEMANVKEWLGNEFTTFITRPSIGQSDIAHRIQFLMGTKLVAKKHNRMIENDFGLIFLHSMTEEPIGEDFDLMYVYKVDLTDAAAESYLPQAGPSVRIMDVVRKVSPPAPHNVCIRVDKNVYEKFAMALKTLAGSWLKNQKERAAMGLTPKVNFDDPNLWISRTEYDNFMSQMDLHLEAAANSLIRGDNTNTVFRIVRQAPSVYALPRYRPFGNVMDRPEQARRLNAMVPQLAFGINKMLPVDNSERCSTSQVLSDILQYFDMHTDNDASIEALQGHFSGAGAPFKKPDAVVLTTTRMLKKLYHANVVQSAAVDLNMIMTVLRLTQDDMHPMRTVAPQTAVSFKNGSYVRDENKQMAKHTHTTPDYKVHYAKLDGKNVIFVPIDDGRFSNHMARDAKFTTMSSFDYMMPTGVAMTENGKVLPGPTKQSTTFSNEKGVRYALSCEMAKPFLLHLFDEYEFDTYDTSDSRHDQDTMEKAMVFYRARSTAGSSREGSDGRGGWEGEEGGEEGTTLYRNVYMCDNVFYDNDIMVLNIISVLQNRTAPGLRSLFATQPDKSRPAPYHASSSGENQDTSEGADLSDSREEAGSKTSQGARRVNEFDSELIVAMVQTYMDKMKTPCSSDDVTTVFGRLYALKNITAVEYLKHINMGFGLLWVKPEFIQADSMLFCRPAGFSHFGGSPTQSRKKEMSDESQTMLYHSQAYSTTSRLSLGGYPAIMWKNAALIEAQSTSSDKVVNPLEPSEMRDTLNWLKAMRRAGVEDKTLNHGYTAAANCWWYLFSPPKMDKVVFESANSPVGRLATHYKSPEEFSAKFTDRSIMDIKFPNTFTTNQVFGSMDENLNTVFLYNPTLFHTEPEFPFYKYVNFNAQASASVTALEDASTRLVNTTLNMKRSDTETVEPIGVDEANVSHMLGAAFPKTCWSDSDLGSEVLVRKDLKHAQSYRTNTVITKGSTAFYVTGIDALEKFDRSAVNHFSFVY